MINVGINLKNQNKMDKQEFKLKSLEIKESSWKNIFEVIRNNEINPKGSFWASIQSLEEQFEKENKPIKKFNEIEDLKQLKTDEELKEKCNEIVDSLNNFTKNEKYRILKTLSETFLEICQDYDPLKNYRENQNANN